MASMFSGLRRPAQAFPLFPHLAIVPAILAIGTAVALFVHSDVNAALLWSQCHSHELLPHLTRLPILGTPSCFLISFFNAALDSMRTKAVLSVILGYVGSLLTVSTVESARKVNAKNRIIANPTIPWLLFNLVGGALVWQLVIVPAFILGAKGWLLPEQGGEEYDERDDQEEDALCADKKRQMDRTEAVAIPVAVALGYYVPSALMVLLNSPAAVGVWLFFPLYVSLVRKAVRRAVSQLRRFQTSPYVHLESNVRSYVAVYALPVVASILAHGFVIANLTMRDDRKELTRSTVKFIEIDFQFIGLTVLYWVFVETGWRVPLAMVVSTLVLGPGGGMALGWMYRERVITKDLVRQLIEEVNAAENDQEDRITDSQEPSEQTPLIQ